MAEMKTRPTEVKVKDFITTVENDTRRRDAEVLVKLIRKVTGLKPQMWGPTIIGFGTRNYQYESGRTGSICALGFSPRKAHLVFYLGNFPGLEGLLKKLGKHKGGITSCLYINKLADIDMAVLEKIIAGSYASFKKRS